MKKTAEIVIVLAQPTLKAIAMFCRRNRVQNQPDKIPRKMKIRLDQNQEKSYACLKRLARKIGAVGIADVKLGNEFVKNTSLEVNGLRGVLARTRGYVLRKKSVRKNNSATVVARKKERRCVANNVSGAPLDELVRL